MRANQKKVPSWLLAAFLLPFLLISSTTAEEAGSLDDALKYLGQYEWGQSVAPLAPIKKAIAASKPGDQLRTRLETALIGILASNASRGAKDVACRKLSRIGTDDCVPVLGALLPDAELSDTARYALERIEGDCAGRALREALPKTIGKQQIGVVNSLGMRCDAASVGAISALLASKDTALVSSALAALGRIGTEGCAGPLLAFEATAKAPLKGVCANALLSLAEARQAAGDAATATRIYKQLDAENNPVHVRTGAFRGLVMADPKRGTDRILDVLRSGDPHMAPYVQGLLLQMKGADAVWQLAAGLGTLPADRQIVLLEALAAKGDATAADAVRKAVGHADATVRLAALRALGRLGTSDDVAFLARRTSTGATAEREAASRSLAVMKGKHVNEQIVAEAKASDAALRATLIGCLAERHAREFAHTVGSYLADDNPAVRLAALDALGELGGPGQVKAVARRLKDDSERKAAEGTLSRIAARDGRTTAPLLAEAMKGSDEDARRSLLRALGKAGGKAALETVVRSVQDEAALADEAVRVLSGWQNGDAAPHLLDVARTNEKLSRKVLALRGYVRLVSSSKAIKDSDKVRKLSEAMAVAPRVDEKKLVLGACAGIATGSSLSAVLPLIGDKEVGDEACDAAVRIADKLVRKDKTRVRKAMQQVVEKTRSDKIRKSAQKLLEKAGG